MKDFLYKFRQKKPIGNRFFAVLIGASLCFTNPLNAAENGMSSVISLPTAINMTMANHPDLRALAAQNLVWQGRIEQASIGDPLQVGLTVEDALGTGDHNGTENMQTSLTFSWVLQQAQIDSRINTIQQKASALDIEKQIKALDLSSLVAKYFVEILVKQERLKLNKTAMQQAEELVDAIAKRVKLGKSSSVEMRLMQSELMRRKLAVEDIEHDLKSKHYQLASLWGEPQSHFNINGDLNALPTIPSVHNQMALLKQNPMVQQFASAQRIAQSQIELARIEAKPQWQFSTGVRRYEATDDFGLIASISIPWGGSNRNSGTIAALKAQQDVLSLEQSALIQTLDAQLLVLLQEMTHSRHVIQTVSTEIIPNLERALKEANSAFNKGRLNYTQFSDVRNELLSAQNQLLSAYESLHLQHIEIQRLTGSSISQ